METGIFKELPIEIELSKTAFLKYIPNFIAPADTETLMAELIKKTEWVQSEISLFGKKVAIPRLNAWYGDYSYGYSGTKFTPRPWTPTLTNLKLRIERESNLQFNSVLMNWYRGGDDSMGWHTDNEASLGKDPQIASISLGETRRFLLRSNEDKSTKHTLPLASGSLLLMLGSVQSDWQHCVPKTRLPCTDRINLTYRYVVP